MKKITLILLISIYALSVVGYSIKGFYCCGNLKSVSISFTQHPKPHSTTSDKSDCCKTKYQFFKVKDNHVAAAHIQSPEIYFIKANVFTDSFQAALFTVRKIIVANPCNAPPLHKGVPIHLFNCSFLV